MSDKSKLLSLCACLTIIILVIIILAFAYRKINKYDLEHPLNTSVTGVGATARIVLIGGSSNEMERSMETMEIYYVGKSENNFIHDILMDIPRYGHVSVLLPNRTIFSAGGKDISAHILFDTECFDVYSGKVYPAPQLIQERYGAAGALLNVSFYICGGSTLGMWLSSCEKLDLTQNKFVQIASMIKTREHFAMISFDSNLYAFGGWNGKHYLDSVERYNLDTESWTLLDPMPTPGGKFGATLLYNIIFTCGGYRRGKRVADCYRYDLKTDVWIAASPMSKAKHGFTMVAMNGKVYAMGGVGLNLVEEYDSQSDQWTTVHPMNGSRVLHTAVVVVKL